jgi:hypothetical protein
MPFLYRRAYGTAPTSQGIASIRSDPLSLLSAADINGRAEYRV